MLISSNNIGGLARFEEVGMETIRAHTHTHSHKKNTYKHQQQSVLRLSREGWLGGASLPNLPEFR